MIRRSGARSIPELLRMVPGLYVARIDSNKWNVSSRGFSSRFARKLLVQIDGRTVYSPLIAGTFWDVQDVLLKDIERIEIIRGPGATLWGENAVNGIINILTKSAKETHGVYVESGGGTEERGFASTRVGSVSDSGVHWRVYSKWFERDRQFHPAGQASDDWRQGRVGFRADWDPSCCDSYTLQGDYYVGSNGIANQQPLIGLGVGNEPVFGGNLVGRWTRVFDDESDMTLQIYYDRTERDTLGFDQNINIFDVDFQHRFPLSDRHKAIWGVGYRRIWDRLPNSNVPAILAMNPTERTVELFSAFIQDEITLVEDSLFFTLGTKIGDNTYTDFEVQPSARLLWQVNEQNAAWASVSRAVRIPSRVEHDGRIVINDIGGVTPITLTGSRNLVAEELIAYEIGYRQQLSDRFSWDLALFYNVDEDLVNFRSTSTPTTLQFFNGTRAESYGVELAGQVDVTETWRVFGWYSFLRLNFKNDPSALASEEVNEGGNPTHQVFLMSSWDLCEDLELDVLARYVDNVTFANLSHYISMDIRLAWRASENMEFTVVGQNLLDSRRQEYRSSLFVFEVPTEVQRGVYAMMSWDY